MLLKHLLSTLSGLFLQIYAFDLVIVSREEWGARPSKLVERMENPVPFVVIHHSATPPACNSTEDCIYAMQWMQKFHQDERGWNDIGYSFAVGGDGLAYEGRGWSAIGAHAPGFNNQSIGICLIGDWRYTLPPPKQLITAKKLIDYGVELGMIAPGYKLIGHKQVKDTECPGETLFAEIEKWGHFTPDPFKFQLFQRRTFQQQQQHNHQQHQHQLSPPHSTSYEFDSSKYSNIVPT